MSRRAVSATWVKLTSSCNPKFTIAPSLPSVRSSPTLASPVAVRIVADSSPLEALYVSWESVLAPRFPVALSANNGNEVASLESATVMVVATVASDAVPLNVPLKEVALSAPVPVLYVSAVWSASSPSVPAITTRPLVRSLTFAVARVDPEATVSVLSSTVAPVTSSVPPTSMFVGSAALLILATHCGALPLEVIT